MYSGKVSRSKERGSSVAEFAIVAGIFFMIIFGIIEFGRLLYTHNALTDAARRAARYAVLNPEGDACVKNVAVYGQTHIDPNTCAPTGPPLINGLTPDKVIVTYNGVVLPGETDPTAYGMNLGTATVTIQNYTFNLGIPFFYRTLTLPAYTTTLTAESAGTEPDPI
jgi:Flp pilus assembly protein TadG